MTPASSSRIRKIPSLVTEVPRVEISDCAAAWRADPVAGEGGGQAVGEVDRLRHQDHRQVRGEEPDHDPGGDLLGRVGGLQRLVGHHDDPADQDQQPVAGVGDPERRPTTGSAPPAIEPGCGVDRAVRPISASSGLTAELTSPANQPVIALVTWQVTSKSPQPAASPGSGQAPAAGDAGRAGGCRRPGRSRPSARAGRRLAAAAGRPGAAAASAVRAARPRRRPGRRARRLPRAGRPGGPARGGAGPGRGRGAASSADQGLQHGHDDRGEDRQARSRSRRTRSAVLAFSTSAGSPLASR